MGSSRDTAGVATGHRSSMAPFRSSVVSNIALVSRLKLAISMHEWNRFLAVSTVSQQL